MAHVGDAELLASELVANAAEHGDNNPIGLTLRRHAEPGGQHGITCEVTDTSPDVPRPRDAEPAAERGAHARNTAGVPAVRPGGESPRITAAATRAALRAAGLPPHLAASMRGRLRLVPEQEGEQ